MKNLKVKSILFSLLAIFATSIFMASCDQEELQIGNSLESPVTSLKNIRVENQNGILKFEGGEDFFAEFELLNNATTEELIAFTDDLGFESYLSAVTDAYAKLETVSSSDEMEAFENTYSHLFTFENDQIAEKIENLAYAAITNVEGLVLIGNYAMKVEKGRVIEELTGDLEALRNLNPLSNLDELPNTNVVYSRAIPSGCPNSSTAWTETSSRKLDFSITVYPVSCGCGQYRTFYTIKAKGYKKSWGKWKSYKTYLEFECVDFTVKVNGTSYSVSGISKNQDNVKEMTRTGWIGPFVLDYPSFQLYKVRGRGSSRGVGTKWAVICCNYGTSCPSNTGYAGNCP